MRKLSLTFAAGAFGGLAASLAAWLCAEMGLVGMVGVDPAPVWTGAWFYERVAWGGLFGLFFLLPGSPRRDFTVRGVGLSLAPSLFLLLWVYPVHLGQGWLGIELGWATPLLTLVLDAVWGAAAGMWLEWCGFRELTRQRLSVTAIKI